MLNFCIFTFIIFAVALIVAMIVRPAEFFTVFKREKRPSDRTEKQRFARQRF